MVAINLYHCFLALFTSCWGIWSVQSFAILGPASVSLRHQFASQIHSACSATINPTRPTLLYATPEDTSDAPTPTSQADQPSQDPVSSSSNATEEEAKSSNATASASASDSTSKTVDISQTPAFLLKKLEGLQKKLNETEGEIEVAEEQLKQAKDEWAPELARLHNDRERLDSVLDSKTIKEEALADVVLPTLELVDNFDRSFIGSNPKSEEDEKIMEEYRSVYTEMLDIFSKHGVHQVETVGKEFDVECHQAIMQDDSDQYEEGIVCEEFQKGFKIGDRLIREALVAVAA
eukprot:Nitzschia sp. Nitz4//scaffold112_size70979//15790//16758//NITZ4_005895-RA/size70979-exonerate_est2genome-gene-0.50-mRNA-1//1//CDS//3329533244//6478//frame0